MPETNRKLVTEHVEDNDDTLSTLTEHFKVTKLMTDRLTFSKLCQLFSDMPTRKLHRVGIVYDKNLTLIM